MNKVVLELKDVVYSYKMKTGNNVNVIRNASCVFETGKVYAIQCGKDTGKSTLVKLMAGFDMVDGGMVLFNGEDIRHMNHLEYRSTKIGCCLSGKDLIPKYTARENIMLQLDIGNKIDTAMRKQVTEELLDTVGLEAGARNQKTMKMTEIRRQRTRLARGLATFGEVILFDDVSDGLTNEETRSLLEIFYSIAANQQKCVIFTTDSPNAAEGAESVYTISRGTVSKVR